MIHALELFSGIEAGDVTLVGIAGAVVVYATRRLLMQEEPFLRTIKHQDQEIADLRAEMIELRRELALVRVRSVVDQRRIAALEAHMVKEGVTPPNGDTHGS